MSNKFRKVLAAILAGTMVLGSGVVANAAEGQGEGTGDLDIVKNQDIFQVVLPTGTEDQFNYILDPTGVIEQTDHAKYASASFVDGQTLYFRQKPASGSDIATYSNVTDPIKAYNMSTMAVDIKVEASVSTPSGIEMATTQISTGAPAGDPNTATPSIYLALQAGGNDSPITTTAAVATDSMPGAANRYEVIYDNDSKEYKKQLDSTGSNAIKAGADADYNNVFQSYSFTLMGECNRDGKWRDVDVENLPKVTLVWTIDKPDGAVEVSNDLSVSPTGLITHTGLTADRKYVSMEITNKNGTFDIGEAPVEWNLANYSEETGGSYTCQLGDFWMETLRGFSGGKVTVTLSDGSTVEADINIPAA